MLHETIRAICVNRVAPLQGPDHAYIQQQLALFNQSRLVAGLGESDGPEDVALRCALLELESAFVRWVLEALSPLVEDVPRDADAFVQWFEALRATGPGQGDPLFPWLAERATFEQMRWFLAQEVS